MNVERIPRAMLASVLVQVSSDRGFGGAVYLLSGRATLSDCTLRSNVAKLVSFVGGLHASGGAAAVGDSGMLELFGVQMHSNSAGGKGRNEVQVLAKKVSDANRFARAAHIDCAGTITLINSRISLPQAVDPLPYEATAFITASGAGTIMLRDSSFESAVAGTMLVRLVGPQSQSVIRGCTAVNVGVDVDAANSSPATRFAAVNSSFEPPLPMLHAAVKPPDCSAVVAGERVCDPRADCQPGASGGVKCSCVGEGLQDRPGVVADGRLCQQSTRVDLLVQSKTIILKAQKPSNYSEKLAVTVRAEGEATFAVQYSLGITHISGSDDNRTTRGNATWPSLHDQQLSLDGFVITWDKPPSDEAEVHLDRDTAQFTASKLHTLRVSLDCGGGKLCIADGDRIETVMHIGAPSDPSSMRSEVRFITDVEALVSCERTSSQVWVERDVRDLPPHTPFRVRLTAVDVDGLPVSFTRADIRFLFDNKSLPVQWNWGSNEYAAVVNEELTGDTGEHELLVLAAHGWSQADARMKDCVLFHRVIAVVPDRSQVILACCLASVLLVAAGALGYLMLKNREKAMHLLISFLTFEGLLIVEVLLELWGALDRLLEAS